MSRRAPFARAIALLLSWVMPATTVWADWPAAPASPPGATAAQAAQAVPPAPEPSAEAAREVGEGDTALPPLNFGCDKPVRPILECVIKLGTNQWVSYWGYKNENHIDVTIPIGSKNKFSPNPQDRGQPTVFHPGQTPHYPNAAFSVPFNGSNLSWTLKGPDNQSRTVTASSNSPKCQPPPDNTPPQVTIPSPANGAFLTTGTPTFTVQYQDAGGLQLASFEAILDGVNRASLFTVGPSQATWTPTPAQALVSGAHQFTARIRDVANNQGSATSSFTVDVQAPIVTIAFPDEGSYHRQLPVFSGTVQDLDPTTTAVCRVGAASVGAVLVWSGSTASFTCTPPLVEGSNLVEVVATDRGGRQGSASRHAYLDTTPPAVSISVPLEGDYTSAAAQSVSGSVVDASPVTVRVDGVTAVVTGSGFIAPAVPVGPEPAHTFHALAEDAAGNVAEATVTIHVDRTLPQVHITSPAAGSVVSGPSLDVAGTVVDASPVAVDVNGVLAVVTGTGFSATVPAPDGALLLRATARDAALNTGVDERTVTVDSGAPVIQVASPPDGLVTSAASVTIQGTVTDASPVTLTIDGAAVPVNGGAFAHEAALAAEGLHTFTLVATDTAGNPSAPTLLHVVVDRTAPTLTVATPAQGAILNSLPVHVQGLSQDATAVTVTVNGFPATATGGAWQIDLDNLPEGAQDLTVVARDEAGNEVVVLRHITLDLGAPVVTIGVPQPGSVTREATITVSGSVADTNLASVQVNGIPAVITPAGPGAWDFTAAAVPLTEGDNVLVAVATDTSGATGEAQVLVTRDSTPPQADLLCPYQIAPGQTLPVEATVTDNLGVSEVVMRVDGAEAGTFTTPPYHIDLTPPPTAHNGDTLAVSVEAQDIAGNTATDSCGVHVVEGGIVAGQVLSDTTSLPIEAATVELVSESAPAAATDDRGRYTLPVAGAQVVLRASRWGMTSVERATAIQPGVGTLPVDARLTPLAQPVTVGPLGGTLSAASVRYTTAGPVAVGIQVGVPAGAVGADTAFRLTALSSQGLPGLLPLGWAPAAAFELRGDGAVAPPLDLNATGLPQGPLHLVSYSATLHAWLMAAPSLDTSGGALAVPLPGVGAYALVRADEVDPPLSIPAPGEPLPSASFVAIPDPATSTSTVTPPTLPPTGGIAVGSLVVSSPEALPSGTVVQAEVTETFTLADGQVVSEELRRQDILLFREDPDAAGMRADFPITPAAQFDPADLVQGKVHLDVLAGREGVRGSAGGSSPVTVSDADVTLRVPAGALTEDTVISVDAVDVSSFVPELPALTPFREAVVDFSGHVLSMPAELSADGSAVPAGETLLLAQVVWIEGTPRVVLASFLALDNGRVVTVSSPGLPGVKSEGRYVFYRTSLAVGLVSGTTRAAGIPVAAVVSTTSLPFFGVAASDGSYVLLAAAGPATVNARVPGTSLAGTASVDVVTGASVPLDIALAGTATTVSVSPGDGAVGVQVGVQVELHASGPLQAGSITSDSVRLLKASDGSVVAVRFVLSASGLTLAVIPEAPLAYETAYSLVVSGLVDTFGAPVVVPATTFTTKDNTPPAYDTDLIVFSFPDAAGIVHVTAPAGAMPPGTEILIINSGNGVVVSFTFGNDGSLDGELPADLDDQLLVTITDPFGNVTTFTRSQYVAEDGTTAVGAGGGVVEGEGGIEVRIPAGATPEPVLLKIEPFAEDAFPAEELPRMLDEQGNPLAQFGAGLKIDSPDKPQFAREVDLAFPLPPGLPPIPTQAFFYVFRRIQGPNGAVINETIDQAFIEGTGADARVVTASFPFGGYNSSFGGYGVGGGLEGSLSNFAFMMWSFDSALPGLPLPGAITGRVTRTVWHPGSPTPSFEPLPLSQVKVERQLGNDEVATIAVTQPDAPGLESGRYTLFDPRYVGGPVEVTATAIIDGVEKTKTVTAFQSNPVDWLTTGLRFYQNIAVANILFETDATPEAPEFQVVIRNAATQVPISGIVTLGTPLEAVLIADGATVDAAALSGQACHLEYPDPGDLSAARVDFTTDITCQVVAPGTYTFTARAVPPLGAALTVARSFLVVTPGGGNTQVLDGIAPAVVAVSPADDAQNVAVGTVPAIVFSEPVRNVPAKPHLEEISDTGSPIAEVDVTLIAVLRDGSVLELPADAFDAEVVSLTLRPAAGLKYGVRYRIRLDAGIQDLDPANGGGPRELPPFVSTFRTFQPGPVGGTEGVSYGSPGITVVGDRAFLAEIQNFNSGTVHSFDLTQLPDITEVVTAQAHVFQRPVDLAGQASDNTLGVATTITAQSKPSNMYVFDVADHNSTRWVGVSSVSSSSVDGYLVRMAIQGPYIYALTGRKGIQVVDIAEAKHVFEVEGGNGDPATSAYWNMIHDMHTDGLGFGQSAVIATIPYRVTSTENWSLYDIGVGNYLLNGLSQPVTFVAAEERHAFNKPFLLVGNPQQATEVARAEVLSPTDQPIAARELGLGRVGSRELAVVGGSGPFGPAGELGSALRIFDVTNPAAPEALGFLALEATPDYSGDITDIQVHNGLALVAGTTGVALVSLSDADLPLQVGVLSGLGGRLAFSADGAVLGTTYTIFGNNQTGGGIQVGNLDPPLCPSVSTLLTPRVIVKVTRDPVNGTSCGDDEAIVFRLCKAARVTLNVDGVVFDGEVDDGPLGQISGMPLEAGIHSVRIHHEDYALNFDETPFELSAEAEDAPSENHPGTIETDLRNRSVLPVGHTFVKGVDTLDGHLVRQSTDLKVPGRHLGLEVTRTYSSAAKGADGVIGAGWSWNYASQLTPSGCGLVSLSTPDGSSQVFQQAAGGAYTPQKGYHGKLERKPDGVFVYTDKSGTKHFYRELAEAPPDPTLRLDYVEEPHGDQLRTTYDGQGRLVRVAETHRGAPDVAVRWIDVEYTDVPKAGFFRIASIKAPALGLEVGYEYDAKGNLTTVTRSKANIDGQLDAEADRVESYEYKDTSPRDPYQMKAAIDPNGNRTEFEYLTLADPDPGSPPTTLILDREEYAKKVIEKPGGGIPDYETIFDYQARTATSNVTRVRDARENWTRYELNGNGSPEKIVENSEDPDNSRQTVMHWATADVLKTDEIDAELRATFYKYEDGNGNLTEERIVSKDGDELLVTEYTYNTTFNKLEKKTVKDPVPPGDRVTEYGIDSQNGDLLSMTDAEGNQTLYSYDGGGAGLLTQVRSPRGYTTLHSDHDSFGNARQIQDPEGNTISREYDVRGRMTREHDSFERDATTVYDGLDRPVVVTRAAGDGQLDPVTRTDYYPSGEPRKVQRLVRAGEWIVTDYDLDGLNRVIGSVTSGFGLEAPVATSTSYDPNGNKKTETDGRGVVRRMEYDPLNRLKQVFIDAGPAPGPTSLIAEYSYDKVGNKKTEADINGFVTSFEYDGLYRVVKKVLPEPRSSGPDGGSGNYEETYAYDRLGNRTSAKDANGKETRYEYDKLNRVKILTRDFGGKNLRTFTAYDDPEPNAHVNKTQELDEARGLRTLFTHDRIDRELTRTLRLEGEDGDGDPTVLSYTTETHYLDGLEHAVEVRDPRTFTTYARLDKLDRPVQQIVDPPGLALETVTAYDGLGNKASVRDPRGHSSFLVFDGLGRLKTATDADGQVTAYAYDGEGLKLSETDRRGVRKTFSYDNLARSTGSALDLQQGLNISNVPWSHETRYEDGPAPRRIEKDAKGTESAFDLDRLGRVVKVTDFFGNFTQTRWDGLNRREERDKRVNSTLFHYDGLNRVVLVTDPAPFSQQTVVTSYLDAANRVEEKDRRGILKITQSDPLGRVRSVARRRQTAPPEDAVVLERNAYDGNGNKELATDAGGHQTHFDYDAANRLIRKTEGFQALPAEQVVTEYRYDKNGNKTKEIDGRSSEDFPAMESTYDVLNRVEDAFNGEREKTHYGYDAEGNRTLVREPKLFDTAFQYDELGKLLSVTPQSTPPTTYGYDRNRNRVSQKDANQNVVEMTYDELDRLDLMTQKGAPEGDLVTDHDYDANGNETLLTDPKGQKVQNTTYDELNRLRTREYDAALPGDLAALWRHTTRVDYVYDENNNVTDSKDYVTSGLDPPPTQPNLLTHRVYDDLDRLSSEATPLPAEPTQSITVNYAYNDNGTRRSVTDDAGLETRYTYDAVNRVQSATTAYGTPQAATTGYSYWPDSLLEDVSFPNGVTAHHEYDAADRLLSLTNAGAAAVSSYVYSYDDNGNRLTQQETNGGATELTSYTYDHLNRLDTVTYPADATFAHGRLVDYGYDDVGNRTSELTTDPVTTNILSSKTGHFDALNRLTELTDPDPAQTVVFGYDKNGNQTSKTIGTGTPSLFRYDIRDKLVEVQSGPSGPILSRFQYDCEGRRTEKIGEDGIVQYVYDGTSTFLELNEFGTRLAKYDYGSDRLISLFRSGQRRFFVLDGLGSVVNLTNDSGAATASYHLDAWGNYRFPSELNPPGDPVGAKNRFGFTGHIFDSETDLYFAKARYYDPETGRFTSQDSYLGEEDEPPSLHRYFYANDNPLRYVDPDGHESLGEIAARERARLEAIKQKAPAFTNDMGGNVVRADGPTAAPNRPVANGDPGYEIRDEADRIVANHAPDASVVVEDGQDPPRDDGPIGNIVNPLIDKAIDVQNKVMAPVDRAIDKAGEDAGARARAFVEDQKTKGILGDRRKTIEEGLPDWDDSTSRLGRDFKKDVADIAEEGARKGVQKGVPMIAGVVLKRVTPQIELPGVGKKPRGSHHPTTRAKSIIGQEAHRQKEAWWRKKGYRTEVTIELEDGQRVRKDALKGRNTVIIKPDTETGRSAGETRAELMKKNKFKPEIDLYDPDDPAYQPGSPTYIGPGSKKKK